MKYFLFFGALLMLAAMMFYIIPLHNTVLTLILGGLATYGIIIVMWDAWFMISDEAYERRMNKSFNRLNSLIAQLNEARNAEEYD